MTSAGQDAWVELAEAIREQVRKQAAYVPAMEPDEVRAFVEAARVALWLETDALTFDKEVELRQAKMFAD